MAIMRSEDWGRAIRDRESFLSIVTVGPQVEPGRQKERAHQVLACPGLQRTVGATGRMCKKLQNPE